MPIFGQNLSKWPSLGQVSPPSPIALVKEVESEWEGVATATGVPGLVWGGCRKVPRRRGSRPVTWGWGVGVRMGRWGVEVSRPPARGSPRWVPELGKAPFLTCCGTLGKERMGGCSENLKTLRDIVEGKEEASHLLTMLRCMSGALPVWGDGIGDVSPSVRALLSLCSPLPLFLCSLLRGDRCGALWRWGVAILSTTVRTRRKKGSQHGPEK